ncbi:MAG: hypothetical protein HY606_14280, partial [Planctomycetes bacterium]|nr:hypothetical protein [Planctomycetota bacterium]
KFKDINSEQDQISTESGDNHANATETAADNTSPPEIVTAKSQESPEKSIESIKKLQIKGKVLHFEEDPVSNATISFFIHSRSNQVLKIGSTFSDSSGQFNFEYSNASDYNKENIIFVNWSYSKPDLKSSSYKLGDHTFYSGNCSFNFFTKIEISTPDDTIIILLEAQKPPSVIFNITFDDGATFKEDWIYGKAKSAGKLWLEDEEEHTFAVNAYNNKIDYFPANIPLKFQIFVEGYKPWSEEIVLSPGETLRLNITLAKDANLFTGRCTDENSVALTGVNIQIRQGKYWLKSSTDSNGQFKINIDQTAIIDEFNATKDKESGPADSPFITRDYQLFRRNVPVSELTSVILKKVKAIKLNISISSKLKNEFQNGEYELLHIDPSSPESRKIDVISPYTKNGYVYYVEPLYVTNGINKFILKLMDQGSMEWRTHCEKEIIIKESSQIVNLVIN